MASNLPSRCPFCGGRFRDPKVMPCFHIFCRECVRGLKVTGVEELKCPVDRCNRLFKLEDGDPETLPDAFPVYFKQDLVRLKDKVHNKAGHCVQCLRDKKREQVATAFCDQCEYICAGCVKAHKKDHVKFSDHEVTSFLTLSQKEDDSEHYEVLRRQRVLSFTQNRGAKCRVHRGQRCESYCHDCLAFTCPECTIGEHREHRIRNRERACEECKVELQERLPNIRLLNKRAASVADDVQKTRIRVEDQQKELASSIDHTFERLFRILEQRKAELHHQLKDTATDKINSLQKQHSKVSQLVGKLQRLEAFTEATVELSTDIELLTNYEFISVEMEKCIKEGSSASTQPVATANVALKNSALPHLRDVSHKHIRLYAKQANPSSCTAEGEGLVRAETFKMAHFQVNTHDRLHKPCSSAQDVSVLVKCLENDFQAWAEVGDLRQGKCDVSFCPQFRGNHEITVHVNGKPIMGSPFHLRVSKPPYQLGRSQGTIPDVTGPRGITMDESGHILVCEWNGSRVVKLDKLARQVAVFGTGQLSHPASIALDKRGNLYVVDGSGESSKIVKFEYNGRLLRSVGRQGSDVKQFKNPRGIKLNSKEEVYVCDRDNHRIQVFNQRLEFQRCIDMRALDPQLKQPAKPNDLAFDNGGTIYVTDYANDCILVFSPSEQYLYFFGREVVVKKHRPRQEVVVVNGNGFLGSSPDHKSESGLAGPECITIDKNNILYVTESGSHRVSVYWTTGELVTRFGSVGRNAGEMRFPMGIATDQNGSVYVCEMLNNRIQIF
jgi:DNA-binding beta-propeller fold protein YncE